MLNKLIKLLLITLSFKLSAFAIYPAVSGDITFHKTTGDSFNKGDLLISIDSSDAKLNLEYEQALLEGVKQNFIDRELDYNKEQELYDRLVSSKKNLDKIKLEFIYAKNELKTQQIKVQIAKNNLAKYQILAPFNGNVESINMVNTINQNFDKELMIIKKK